MLTINKYSYHASDRDRVTVVRKEEVAMNKREEKIEPGIFGSTKAHLLYVSF